MKKMKKLLTVGLLVLGLTLYTSTNLSAQSFEEGDLVINAGIGLGSVYGWTGTGSLGLPIGAGVEYGVADLETGSIGVGGDFGFVSSSFVTVYTFGARGSYYFNDLFELENEKVDLYGGLGLYYRAWSWSGNTFSGFGGITAAFHAGGRYYFADNIGGYAELGNNWGWLNVGIVFKL